MTKNSLFASYAVRVNTVIIQTKELRDRARAEAEAAENEKLKGF